MTKANLSRLSDFNYSSSMTDSVSRAFAISNLVHWKMLALSVVKDKISNMLGKNHRSHHMYAANCLLKEMNVETRHLMDDGWNFSLLLLFLLSLFSCSSRLPADNSPCIAVSTNGFFQIVLARKAKRPMKICRRLRDRCRGNIGCKKRNEEYT